MPHVLVHAAKRFAVLPAYAHIVWLAIRVELLVRRRPVPLLARWAGLAWMEVPSTGKRRPAPIGRREVTHLHRVSRVFGMLPAQGMCLRQTLVLGRLLDRQDASLTLGVRRQDSGAVVAHAWVVLAGVAFDAEATSYARLDASPL